MRLAFQVAAFGGLREFTVIHQFGGGKEEKREIARLVIYCLCAFLSFLFFSFLFPSSFFFLFSLARLNAHFPGLLVKVVV